MSELSDKMNAILRQLGENLAERDTLLHDMAVALVTKNNLFILGKSGQAKSAAIRSFANCISDARLFAYQLTQETDEERLFGRPDLSSMVPGGVAVDMLESDSAFREARDQLEHRYHQYTEEPSPENFTRLEPARRTVEELRASLASMYGGIPTILTRGKIPEADIVFCDELFKANGGVLNSLLLALNERLYVNEGTEMEIPTVSFFGASNELPNLHDPDEAKYAPLLDRFALKVQTDYVRRPDERQRILERKITGIDGTDFPVKITLDELREMQREVSRVEIPPELNEIMDRIVTDMRASGLPVTDRKFFNYYRIVQACAWLDGRMCAEKNDLLRLENYLWEYPDDIPAIRQILAARCSDRSQEKIDDLRGQIMESYSDFLRARDAGDDLKRATIKFRGELAVLYRNVKALGQEAVSDKERRQILCFTDELEEKSRQIHQMSGMTHIPLDELDLTF